MLSDKQKRTIYDQLGEEGLKGGGVPPQGAGGPGGFSSFGGFPGGTTFTLFDVTSASFFATIHTQPHMATLYVSRCRPLVVLHALFSLPALVADKLTNVV